MLALLALLDSLNVLYYRDKKKQEKKNAIDIAIHAQEGCIVVIIFKLLWFFFLKKSSL